MIYVLRHGQTVWNRAGRIQGQQDSPLTARGIAQARAVGALLAEVVSLQKPAPGKPARAPDLRIVASPLGRAWQTAVIVADCLNIDPSAIALEPRIAELAYGAWEALTLEEIQRKFPEAWAERLADKWIRPAPGGESYAQVAARLEDWLKGLDDEGPVVAVGHGTAGRILRGRYLDATPQHIFAMEEPQDAFFRLQDGTETRFDVADVAA